MPYTSIPSAQPNIYNNDIHTGKIIKKSNATGDNIVTIETHSTNEIKHTCPVSPRINKSFLSCFKGVSITDLSERERAHISDPTDHSLQQIDNVSAKLKHRPNPLIALPFILKRDKKLATGTGTRAGAVSRSHSFVDNNVINSTEKLTPDLTTDDVITEQDGLYFSIKIQPQHIERQNTGNHPLFRYLTTLHKNKFYNDLYDKGDIPSDFQVICSVTNPLIAFYDCTESSITGEVSEAVPNCLISMASLISTGALLTPIGAAFHQRQVHSVYTGSRILAQGSLQNAAKVRMSEIRLSAGSKFTMSGKSRLHFINPNFELIGSDIKFIGKKVIALVRETQQNLPLAEKTLSHQKNGDLIALPHTYGLVKLPDSTISMPVKKIIAKNKNDIDNNQLKSIKKKYCQRHYQNISRMNQYADLWAYYTNHYVPDIRYIPAQSEFLPPLYYTPPHILQNTIPHVDLSVQPHIAQDFSYTAIEIKNFIVENYSQDDVFLCRFNQQQWEIPPAFASLRNNIEQYKAEIKLAKSQVNRLHHEILSTTMRNDYNELNFPESGNRIVNYLSKVLHLDTLADANLVQIIKKESLNRLAFHTKKIRDYLNNEINNIYFVSCDTELHPYIYTIECPMGFIYNKDHFRRIFIMVDNFQYAPMTTTKPHLTVLHEISHYSGSYDFQIANLNHLASDVMVFMNALLDGIYAVKERYNPLNIPDNFLETYHSEHPDRPVDKMQFIEMLKVDPVLRANVFMENADFLASIIADLGSKTPAKHHHWVRRVKEIQPYKSVPLRILTKLLLKKQQNLTLTSLKTKHITNDVGRKILQHHFSHR